jgi:hypothetical protein
MQGAEDRNCPGGEGHATDEMWPGTLATPQRRDFEVVDDWR